MKITGPGPHKVFVTRFKGVIRFGYDITNGSVTFTIKYGDLIKTITNVSGKLDHRDSSIFITKLTDDQFIYITATPSSSSVLWTLELECPLGGVCNGSVIDEGTLAYYWGAGAPIGINDAFAGENYIDNASDIKLPAITEQDYIIKNGVLPYTFYTFEFTNQPGTSFLMYQVYYDNPVTLTVYKADSPTGFSNTNTLLTATQSYKDGFRVYKIDETINTQFLHHIATSENERIAFLAGYTCPIDYQCLKEAMGPLAATLDWWTYGESPWYCTTTQSANCPDSRSVRNGATTNDVRFSWSNAIYTCNNKHIWCDSILRTRITIDSPSLICFKLKIVNTLQDLAWRKVFDKLVFYLTQDDIFFIPCGDDFDSYINSDSTGIISHSATTKKTWDARDTSNWTEFCFPVVQPGTYTLLWQYINIDGLSEAFLDCLELKTLPVTPTPTVTPSITPTPTLTPSNPPTPTYTPTPTLTPSRTPTTTPVHKCNTVVGTFDGYVQYERHIYLQPNTTGSFTVTIAPAHGTTTDRFYYIDVDGDGVNVITVTIPAYTSTKTFGPYVKRTSTPYIKVAWEKYDYPPVITITCPDGIVPTQTPTPTPNPTGTNQPTLTPTTTPTRTAANIPCLCQALDNCTLVWETSGDAPWYCQTQVTHDSVDAAKSGSILSLGRGRRSYSALSTTVTGPGTLKYWEKIDTELGYDVLDFYIDDTLQYRESGVKNWTQKTYPFLDAGVNYKLTWIYSKDQYSDSGADAAWLDEVQWIPSVSPTPTPTPTVTPTVTRDDCPANINTNCALVVDGRTIGYINRSTDCDWFAVNLVENRSYSFTLSAANPSCLDNLVLDIKGYNGESIVFPQKYYDPLVNIHVPYTDTADGETLKRYRVYLHANETYSFGAITNYYDNKVGVVKNALPVTILKNDNTPATTTSCSVILFEKPHPFTCLTPTNTGYYFLDVQIPPNTKTTFTVIDTSVEGLRNQKQMWFQALSSGKYFIEVCDISTYLTCNSSGAYVLSGQHVTSTPSRTPTNTRTPTPTRTPTRTVTPTKTPKVSPTCTPTKTKTPTRTPTITPTPTGPFICSNNSNTVRTPASSTTIRTIKIPNSIVGRLRFSAKSTDGNSFNRYIITYNGVVRFDTNTAVGVISHEFYKYDTTQDTVTIEARNSSLKENLWSYTLTCPDGILPSPTPTITRTPTVTRTQHPTPTPTITKDTCAGDLTTTCTISSGQTKTGTLDYYADLDCYKAVLIPNKQYIIRVNSTEFDTFLEIKDATGRLITYDDDSGDGNNSALFYTAHPSVLQPLLLCVRGYSTNARGSYQLTLIEVPPTPTPTPTQTRTPTPTQTPSSPPTIVCGGIGRVLTQEFKVNVGNLTGQVWITHPTVYHRVNASEAWTNTDTIRGEVITVPGWNRFTGILGTTSTDYQYDYTLTYTALNGTRKTINGIKNGSAFTVTLDDLNTNNTLIDYIIKITCTKYWGPYQEFTANARNFTVQPHHRYAIYENGIQVNTVPTNLGDNPYIYQGWFNKQNSNSVITVKFLEPTNDTIQTVYRYIPDNYHFVGNVYCLPPRVTPTSTSTPTRTPRPTNSSTPTRTPAPTLTPTITRAPKPGGEISIKLWKPGALYGFTIDNGSSPRVLLQLDDGRQLIGGSLFVSPDQVNMQGLVFAEPFETTKIKYKPVYAFQNCHVVALAKQGTKIIVVWCAYLSGESPSTLVVTRIREAAGEFIKDTSFTDYTLEGDQGLPQLTITTDNKIYVYGRIRSVGHIVRLNPDGTRDVTFTSSLNIPTRYISLNPNSGHSMYVSAIQVLSDGKILVLGYLNKVQNSDAGMLVRLLPNGDRDFTFNYLPFDTQVPYNGAVIKVTLPNIENGSLHWPQLIKQGNKFLITNAYALYVSSVRYTFRINADGTVDNTFNTFLMANGHTVRSKCVMQGTKIIVFSTHIQDSSRPVKRFNADGTVDTSWHSTVFQYNMSELYPRTFVGDIYVRTDNTVAVCGIFQYVDDRITQSSRIYNFWSTPGYFVAGYTVLTQDGKLSNPFSFYLMNAFRYGFSFSTTTTTGVVRTAALPNGVYIRSNGYYQPGGAYTSLNINTTLLTEHIKQNVETIKIFSCLGPIIYSTDYLPSGEIKNLYFWDIEVLDSIDTSAASQLEDFQIGASKPFSYDRVPVALTKLDFTKNLKLKTIKVGGFQYLNTILISPANTELELIELSVCGFIDTDLNNLYNSLPNRIGKTAGTIKLNWIPGADNDNTTIATNKNWTIRNY